MTAAALYTGLGVLLALLGGLGVALRREAVARVLAMNVMGSGVFLVLIALARRSAAGPDPVPQAMVLTGIVVAVSATAVALHLAAPPDEGDDA
jgi:multicomponent Na+:H+ antiporter subunit C